MTALLQGDPPSLPMTAAPAAERRVQLALWASGESVWKWAVAGNRMTVDRGESNELALPDFVDGLTLEQLLDRAHPDDAPSVRLAWQRHLRGAHPDIDVSFRLDGADGR